IDICAVLETRWPCYKSKNTGHGFKAFLFGVPKTADGLGIIVPERFRDSIVGVERFDDRLMKIIVVFERRKKFLFSVCSTDCMLRETEDKFRPSRSIDS
ncbi:hypothetical protein V3C99_008321, partial [Haemonchus contortus]